MAGLELGWSWALAGWKKKVDNDRIIKVGGRALAVGIPVEHCGDLSNMHHGDGISTTITDMNGGKTAVGGTKCLH